MEMKKLMEDISAIMEGQLPDYYYHGSSSPITNFSDEFVGKVMMNMDLVYILAPFQVLLLAMPKMVQMV